jgi:alginate O-acetyltransferase complex protein AlgJ
MSSLVTNAPKFIVPVLFLGYAAVADWGFMQNLHAKPGNIPQSVADYFDGAAATQIDAYYKSILPHRVPSIDLLGALRYLTFKEGRSGVVVGKDGWLFTSEEYRAAGDQSVTLARTAKGMAGIRDALARQGVNLVVVPLPAKADIYREHATDQIVPADLEKLYAEFRSQLATQHIETVDTRPAFLDAKAKGAAFLETDTHWTPSGAGAVANVIGKALGAVEGEAAYTLTKARAVERQGDLTKFIVEGGLSRAIGMGPETVEPIEALESADATVADIFGSASIPFVLVGTSYSANEQWSFAQSLKAALGADVLNVAAEGLGPVEPMWKYLASDELKNSPPKTVIWEFPIRYLATPKLWEPKPATPASGA